MIEIRDSIQSDVDYVVENPIEEACKKYGKFTLSGQAKTGLVNGKIIGVGGVIEHWKGMGECWIILSKNVLEHKVEAAICIKRIVEQFIKDLELFRLECSCRADFEKARDMIEFLGFQYEGYKRSYYPDKGDGLMFGKVM
jgi:RimJ/RimL family protein N-acetyltransferase